MERKRISIYFIKLVWLLGVAGAGAQGTPVDLTARDTVTYAERYGLRVGGDLSRLVRSAFDADYQGFELVGDYRISQKFYLAGELGSEQKTTEEDHYSFTSSGNYIRVGVDYNAYENWYGMENLIYAGLRYGFGTFSQTLHGYTIYNSNPYWGEGDIPGTDPGLLQEYRGLTAHWVELALGLKAELFSNLYLGGSVRLSRLVTDKAADNFPNLWIPGFNKVTDGSAFGIGFNYSISYFIPIYKKKNKTIR